MLFRITLVLLAFLITVGCTPRGETRALETILNEKREDFTIAFGNAQKLRVGGEINIITEQLKVIEGATTQEQVKLAASTVSEKLSGLVLRAGYTTRPGIGELVSQYRFISENDELVAIEARKTAEVRLLTLLISEFKTTSFNVDSQKAVG